VIANNSARKGKTLWTENPKGGRIEIHHALDDRGEAAWIARRVLETARARPFEDVAVLYRTNAQSRSIEEAFRRERIPYQLVGAQQFYERREVKDVLAYLKLALNPADDVSFRRIVNVPPRGLGDTTLDAIAEQARAGGIPLLDAARRMAASGALAARATRALEAFLALVDSLVTRAATEPAAIVIEGVLDAVGYEAYLEKSYPGEGADRMDNVRALVSAAIEYEREVDEPTLLGFLDRSALVSDAHDDPPREGARVPGRRAPRDGGERLPALALARQRRRGRGGAPALLRRPDPRPGAPAPLAGDEPAAGRRPDDEHALALPRGDPHGARRRDRLACGRRLGRVGILRRPRRPRAPARGGACSTPSLGHAGGGRRLLDRR
jgi:hypothetical protein